MPKYSTDNLNHDAFIYNPQKKQVKVKNPGDTVDTEALIEEIRNAIRIHTETTVLNLKEFELDNLPVSDLQKILAHIPYTINEVILDDSYKNHKASLIRSMNANAHDKVIIFDSKSKAEENTYSFELSENITSENAKISWVRESNQHAILLIELLEADKHKIYKVHLRGDLVVKKPLNILQGRFFWGTHYRDGRVEVKDLTGKEIHVAETLTDWYVDIDKAQRLLTYAKRKEQEKQYFNLLGEGALSSMFIATVANQLSHSCITWSREALLHAGINVPLSSLIKLATITSLEAKGAKDVPMDANSMARLARVNEHETIQAYFPKQETKLSSDGFIDPNTVLHRASRGPAEFVLGIYTPFMLSCSYGHQDAMNTLLGEYGANPYVNVQSKFCFGLFGRYSAFDCAKSLFFRPYVSKQNQEQSLELLKSIDHNKMIIDAIDRYIANRGEAPQYKTTLSLFGATLMNFGNSKDEKIDAAKAFKEAIESGSHEIDIKFKGALTSGELGKMFKDFMTYGNSEAIKFTQTDISKLSVAAK